MLQKDIIGKIKNKKMKKQDNDIEIKVCSRCNQQKSFNEYHKDKKGIFGLKSSCKSCISTYMKSYTQENKERIKQYEKEYRSNNGEKIKQKVNEYRLKHKEHLYKKSKEYHFQQYHISPYFKIKRLLRDRVSKILGNKGVTKKSNELLGCSGIELKTHLESLFFKEMSWNNHGEIWEIDHIKPCASFDLTDPQQQKECFHYTNLQPLFKTSDIAKSFGYIDYIGNRNKPKKPDLFENED